MATSSDRMNLLDAAKATDPNGAVAVVAEVLSETNTILQDAPTYPSNSNLGNRVTIRSSLPTVSLTKVNKGSVRSKGSTEQRTDTMGIFDGRSEVDVKMKMVLGESGFLRHRKNEDDAFTESLSQSAAETLVYGDQRANEAAFDGLALRLNTLSTALKDSKVISAGGAGADNTSAYVVDWHERFVHLIHPEATKVGIEVKMLGEQSVNDKDGNPFQAMVTTFLWALGLTVKDQRHVGRLANIDVSDIANAGASGYAGPDLILKMTDLLSEMPDPGGAQRCIYVHNKVWAALHKLALAKANAALTIQDYMGRGLHPHFWGFPIRRMDRISLAESLVS